MARTPHAPSHSRYSPFRCEEATITDVNRKTWTVSVTTTHSSKDVNDVQCGTPYHHYKMGEGFHHLPEVGAKCYLGWPSDNSPPFIMAYIGAAAEVYADGEDPLRSTTDGEGSSTDVSYRSNRPDLNPGDIGFTGRDGNFVVIRRGGVLQLGATPVAQRLYLPILNYIKDFAENYSLEVFGGDVHWTVGRSEGDPSANAPSSYVFHMNEFAQDKKASVRVTHFPLQSPSGGEKSAWEVIVAPQGVSREDGSVENETYRMVVQADGSKIEVLGANRTVTVKGDDSLKVEGDRTVEVDGDESHDVGGAFSVKAAGKSSLVGSSVCLGSENAKSPGVLGDALLKWIAAGPFLSSTPGSPVTVNPAAASKLKALLSKTVFLK